MLKSKQKWFAILLTITQYNLFFLSACSVQLKSKKLKQKTEPIERKEDRNKIRIWFL